jgi:hypothetical protein
MEQSTAASLFWTLNQMKEMAAELAITGACPHLNLHFNSITETEELAKPSEIIEESAIAICGA